MFYGVSQLKNLVQRETRGSGDTTVVDVKTLQEAFLNMSRSFASFSCEEFFW